MGLLSKGTPLSWQEARKYADHVRSNGIEQFLSIYSKVKDRSKDKLMWGDEVEYMLVKFDHLNKQAKLELRAVEVLQSLQKDEEELLKNGFVFKELILKIWY
jgi:glutamate--cysteine ligase catalytic subunit